MNAPAFLFGFDRQQLADLAEGLEKGYEARINVGEDCPEVESTTAAAARFIRAALEATAGAPLGYVSKAWSPVNGQGRIFGHCPGANDYVPVFAYSGGPTMERVGWALFDKEGYCSWNGLHTVDPATWADKHGRGFCQEQDRFASDRAPHRYEPVYRLRPGAGAVR